MYTQNAQLQLSALYSLPLTTPIPFFARFTRGARPLAFFDGVLIDCGTQSLKRFVTVMACAVVRPLWRAVVVVHNGAVVGIYWA